MRRAFKEAVPLDFRMRGNLPETCKILSSVGRMTFPLAGKSGPGLTVLYK